METHEIQRLVELSRQLRLDVVRNLAAAGSGHTGASLGLADVFAVLYGCILNVKPENPQWPERDRLILSIGHAAPILYAALANRGFFERQELLTLRRLGSRLQGHPSVDHGLPGVELAAGSLGQGLSVAVGMALAAKMDRANWRVFSIHGDGELQEGSIWEAAMSAAHYRLDNLVALVDRNRLQIDGDTNRVMNLEPLADKWKAFGWHTIVCNGNDVVQLVDAYSDALKFEGSPSVIIAETTMGCGVNQIHNDAQWHGQAPKPPQDTDFLEAINKYYASHG